MVRSKNNYKWLTSAMISLLMGSAFISTVPMVAPSYAAEKEETDSLSRLSGVISSISENHADWVYKPIIYNTTEPSKSDTRNFGYVVHEIASKMESQSEVNKMLRMLADEEPGKVSSFTVEILQNYFSAAATKINIDEKGLIGDIARDVYALRAFYDMALVGSSYRRVIDFITSQHKIEYDAKKENQEKVLAGANLEKDQSIATANSQFESGKQSLEAEYKQITEKNEGIIKGLQDRNAALTKGAIEPKEVGTNKIIIARTEAANLKAKADFDVKLKEATEARDKAIKEANEAYGKVQVKQEAEVSEAEFKYTTGANEYKENFGWFVQQLGTTFLKSAGRFVSGQSLSRQYYNYHLFNKVLIENPQIMKEARLDLVQDLMDIKGFNEMFYLIGIGDDVLQALKLRLESNSQELWKKLGISGSSSGDQKKKSNVDVVDHQEESSQSTPVVLDDYSSQSLNQGTSVLLNNLVPSSSHEIEAVKTLVQSTPEPQANPSFADMVKKTSEKTVEMVREASNQTKAKVAETRSVVETVLGSPEKQVDHSASSSTAAVQGSGSEKKNYPLANPSSDASKASSHFRRRVPTRGGNGYPGGTKANK